VVNPRIVRGLDYYNRTVFEITSSALGAQSTVCAGGRYDTLVRWLGGPDVPGVGFAMGIERFLIVAEAVAQRSGPVRRGVQAIALGAQARTLLVPIVAELRATLDMPAYMDYDDRKLLTQLKSADRNGARYALLLGSEEIASGSLVLRDLEQRTDRTLPLGTGRDVAAAFVEATR
jgi:histidyl-tRNA synthetase